jgi:hypothetical protein
VADTRTEGRRDGARQRPEVSRRCVSPKKRRNSLYRLANNGRCSMEPSNAITPAVSDRGRMKNKLGVQGRTKSMKTLAMIFLLMLGQSVQAQGVAVTGVGTFSCGKYLEFRATKNETQNAAFVSWIWGYLAGLNMEAQRATTENLPDAASTLAYVDKYCGEHPLNNVIQASGELFHELGGRRNTPKE